MPSWTIERHTSTSSWALVSTSTLRLCVNAFNKDFSSTQLNNSLNSTQLFSTQLNSSLQWRNTDLTFWVYLATKDTDLTLWDWLAIYSVLTHKVIGWQPQTHDMTYSPCLSTSQNSNSTWDPVSKCSVCSLKSLCSGTCQLWNRKKWKSKSFINHQYLSNASTFLHSAKS